MKKQEGRRKKEEGRKHLVIYNRSKEVFSHLLTSALFLIFTIMALLYSIAIPKKREVQNSFV
ncbi:hypothetical protein [Okeania sp. KiyG1]|uniref:hypothetical protein n=1 Tax=Okeania sp. KiyG1 TaxID=2720165 RepID=UPI001924E2BD|nr:hypothetical protein [Okeania sp. KiyG1]